MNSVFQQQQKNIAMLTEQKDIACIWFMNFTIFAFLSKDGLQLILSR